MVSEFSQKQLYRSGFAEYLEIEQKAWKKFHRRLNKSPLYKNASWPIKIGLRNAHREGYCCGANIPTEYEWVTKKVEVE
jgi:hypothetical protein